VSVLNKEGLVHISELASEKVDNIHAVIKVADVVSVRVLHVDPHKGKIKLSIKAVTAPEGYVPAPREPRQDRRQENRQHRPRVQHQHTQAPKAKEDLSADSEEEEINYNRADTGANADAAGIHKTRHEGAHRSGGTRFFNKDRGGQQNKAAPKRKKYFTT
jgi:predicted RNA-binding protein with RPS1 domain